MAQHCHWATTATPRTPARKHAHKKGLSATLHPKYKALIKEPLGPLDLGTAWAEALKQRFIVSELVN